MDAHQTETLTLERIKVYDPLLRLLHWWNAVAIVMLAASGQIAEFLEHGPFEDGAWQVHVITGYMLAGGLATRVLWGVFGPARARWSDFWHLQVWLRVLRERRLPAGHGFGHDPLASLAYIVAFGVMVLMVATGLGLAAAQFGAGPLAPWEGVLHDFRHAIKEPHEAGFFVLIGFVVVHVAALVFHERSGQPVAQSMVSGFQYRRLARRAADEDDRQP